MLQSNPSSHKANGIPYRVPGCLFFVLLTAVLLFAAPGVLADKTYSFSPPGQIEALSGGQGYLLLDLDADGAAASLEFKRLSHMGADHPPPRTTYRYKNKATSTVELTGLENGFYLMQLPAGWYQVTRLQAPYFDLPYKMDTAKSRVWRFGIEKGKTNYIGKLSISKERYANHVDIDLHNRIATDLDEINTELADVLLNAPLSSGRGVRDDFFIDLSRVSEQ